VDSSIWSISGGIAGGRQRQYAATVFVRIGRFLFRLPYGTCEHGDDCVFDLLTTPEWPTGVCFEDDGLYCKSSGTNGTATCAPIVPTGGSCADDLFACGSRSYCDSTSGTAKCTVSLTLGQTCSTYGTRCLSSLMCGTDNKCDDLGFAYDTTCSGTPPFP
jgi:hypothetical protein